MVSWLAIYLDIALPKRPQRIPELLAREEVAAILAACTNPRNPMMLELACGCGLRLSEVLAPRIADIDGERRLLRIRRGKSGKIRLVPPSPTLLECLRGDWRAWRPRALSVIPSRRRSLGARACARPARVARASRLAVGLASKTPIRPEDSRA